MLPTGCARREGGRLPTARKKSGSTPGLWAPFQGGPEAPEAKAHCRGICRVSGREAQRELGQGPVNLSCHLLYSRKWRMGQGTGHPRAPQAEAPRFLENTELTFLASSEPGNEGSSPPISLLPATPHRCGHIRALGHQHLQQGLDTDERTPLMGPSKWETNSEA